MFDSPFFKNLRPCKYRPTPNDGLICEFSAFYDCEITDPSTFSLASVNHPYLKEQINNCKNCNLFIYSNK